MSIHALINAPRYKGFLQYRRAFMTCWNLKGKDALDELRKQAVIKQAVDESNKKHAPLPKMDKWLSDYTTRTGFM